MSKKTLAVAFAVSVVVIACTAEGPTTPPQTETLVRAPEPVVSATPIPAPRAVDPTPEPGSAFVLKFYDNAGFELFYNGGASYAGVTASITNFDDQDTPLPVPGYSDGIVPYTVASGSSWNYSFNRQCVQLDVDQPGVKLIGAAYFDQNGKRVSQINDEIRKACGATPCVEKWVADEEATITYGEYGACQQGETACAKVRTVTVEIFETNSCTQARRLKSTREVIDELPCECACVEPKNVTEIPSTVYWNTAILEGQCNPEVLPLVGIEASTVTPSLNCRTTGQQRINLDYVCSEDSFRTRDLCKNVACPTTCDNTPASYKGNANGGLFNLDNSGDAAELAWVNTNVLVGPWEKFDDEGEKDDDCTTADVSAKVVIVKAGSASSIEYSYRTYLNVTAGQQLCSYDPPGSDKAKDISHVTYFRCD